MFGGCRRRCQNSRRHLSAPRQATEKGTTRADTAVLCRGQRRSVKSLVSGGGCLLSLLFSFSAMNVRYLVNKRVLSFFSFNVNRIANVETTANTTWPGFPFSSRRGVLCQGSDALGAVLVGTHPHPHIAPRHGFSIARSRLHDRCPRNASQEQRHPLPGWRSRGPGGPPLWQAGTLPRYSLPRL